MNDVLMTLLSLTLRTGWFQPFLFSIFSQKRDDLSFSFIDKWDESSLMGPYGLIIYIYVCIFGCLVD